MRSIILGLALLALTGCGAVLHEFDTGVYHPVHTPWAAAETARLAQLHGTDPNLETRFLNIGPQDPWAGWYFGRITVCLLDDEGNERPGWWIHNVWWHEWNHHRHGDIRLDEHEEEYRLELIALGLWETP